jgi:hypothetical protein
MAYDWNQHEIARPPWRSTIVPYLPAILIQRAKEGRTITYAELAEALHDHYGLEPKARKTLYGPPVGAVGFALKVLGDKWGERIPPLNVIVVQASTGLPGVGADEVAHYFFDDAGRGMAKNRKAYLDAAMQAVFDYGQRWDRVATALGAETLDPGAGIEDPGDAIPLPKLPRTYETESKEHKALKDWVRKNPAWFDDYGAFDQGENEHWLSSGDRLDAYFDNGKQYLAVEVKPSHASDAELMRGVYQCVKYKAVLRAERIALRRAPLGEAVLVSTRRPNREIRALLKRLHLDFVLAPAEAEVP